jgi:hypothetical protein
MGRVGAEQGEGVDLQDSGDLRDEAWLRLLSPPLPMPDPLFA